MKLIEYLKNKYYQLPNSVVWIIIILLFFVAVSMYEFLLIPQINLKGSRIIYLNYGEKYKEEGYSSSFLGKNLTDRVLVNEHINSNKAGMYKINYFIKDQNLSKSVNRYVFVADFTKPHINVPKGDIYVCPGKKLGNIKYSAYDKHDGNLSKKVKVIKRHGKIVYAVSDSFNNTAKVVKNVFYKDNLAPRIILNGNDTVYVNVDSKFRDDGFKSIDNCDGDITKNVKIDSNVNTKKMGEYVIRYHSKDSNGNSSTISRKVVVAPKSMNGSIYLTFDDGPNEGTTNVILDILRDEKVKATFFVTNRGPDDLIRREFEEGHSIGLHTASHNYSYIYATGDNYFNDLNVVSNRVKNITGLDSKIIRFPGGSSNTVSRHYSQGIMSFLTEEVQKRGYRYYDWNLSSGDAESGGHEASEIYNNVVSRLSKDRVNVVLMHDIKSYTRDALRDIIKYAKDNGYTFEKIVPATDMVTQRVNN